MDLQSTLTAAYLLLILGPIGLVAHRLLTGSVNIFGLLSSETDGRADPERVQLLGVTIAAAGWYVMLGLQSIGQTPPVTSLPEPPDWILALFGGSHVVFLGGKLMRRQT